MSKSRIRVAIITVSDRCYRGEREDKSGETLAGLVKTLPAEVVERNCVPDVQRTISDVMRGVAAYADVVLTTGGTGISPRDVTPEATRDVIERELPGFAEILRVKGYESTPRSILSRGVSGVYHDTLIVNMPGSVRAVEECFPLVAPAIVHAVELLKGEVTDCGTEE